MTGAYQNCIPLLPNCVRLLSLECRVSKQCPVIIRAVSGCYQKMYGYCHSIVRLLLKHCSATVTRLSEYIIKALPGNFQTSVRLLSNRCRAIIKRVCATYESPIRLLLQRWPVIVNAVCSCQRGRCCLNFMF